MSMFVCPLVYLGNNTSELHEIFLCIYSMRMAMA